MNSLKKINPLKKLSEKQVIIVFFLIALFARIGIIILFGQKQYLYENGDIALNLISGNGFSMRFFPSTQNQETCAMAPFYPYFIAFFYLIFGVNTTAVFIIQIIQALIGALTIWPIYLLAKEFFSHKIAIWSCLIFAGYPDFLYSAYYVHQLTFTTFLILTLILYSYRLYQEPTYNKAVFNGVLYGFSLLVEPLLILLFVLITIWIFILWLNLKFFRKHIPNFKIHNIALKKKFSLIVLMGVCCVLIITPWLIRCYFVYDNRFVLLKANGYNLWRGHNSEYTEIVIPSNFSLEYDNLTKEGEIDQFYFNLAIEYIFNHIPETIVNSFWKFIDFWWFPKALPSQSPPLRILAYSPLLALFILGLIINRKKLIVLLPLLIPMLSFTLIYSATFVLPRYRVPIQPLMFILSASTLIKCVNLILERQSFKKGQKEKY